MPYKQADFAVLQYAGKFTIYFYGSDDDITETGYFDRIANRVNQGDLILHQRKVDGDVYLTYYKIAQADPKKVTLVLWQGDKVPAPKPKEETAEADTPAPTKGFTAKAPEETPAPAEQDDSPAKKKGK